MTGPKVVGSIASDAPATTDEKPSVSDKPTKPLPTDRVGFQKQLEQLRGYAALASQGQRVVTNPDVAALVKIHPNTAILSHPFFIDVGFLKKEGSGYVVASEVLAYGKAFNWNAETAPTKLGPLLRRAWFADALVPNALMGPVQEREAIELLAAASGAGPRYESQLKTILLYLTVGGLIRRDGDAYRAVVSAQEEAPVPQPETSSRVESEDPPRYAAPAPRGGSSLSTAFAAAPEGVLRFNVDVSVDMKEFSTWKPDRIAAFWAGIAQVLAAKAGVEQEAGR